MRRLFIASTRGVIEMGELPVEEPRRPLAPAERAHLKALWQDFPRRLAAAELEPIPKALCGDDFDEGTFQELHRIVTSYTEGVYRFGTNMLDFRIDLDEQRVTIDHVLAGETPADTMSLERFRFLIAASG